MTKNTNTKTAKTTPTTTINLNDGTSEDILLKSLDWTPETWAVSQFIEKRPRINCSPVGQRPPVQAFLAGLPTPSKSQSIINSMLLGNDIGEVKLRIIRDDEIFDSEVIDGGHRFRAIDDYVNGRFSLHKSSRYGEKSYGKLSAGLKEFFDNIQVRVVLYHDLDEAKSGVLFRECNNVTQVNFMEMLNSHSNLPIAKLIRETVRRIPSMSRDKHKLFNCTDSKSKTKTTQNFEWLGYDNSRLKMEEHLARIVYRLHTGENKDYPHNGWLGTSTKKELQAMYIESKFNDEDIKSLEIKTKKYLNFILEVAAARKDDTKKGLSHKEMVMLSRLYLHYSGNIHMQDDNYKFFWAEFNKAMASLSNKVKDPKDYTADDKKNKNIFPKPHQNDKGVAFANQVIAEQGPDGEHRLRHEAFSGYIGDHETLFKVTDSVKWLLEVFDLQKAGVVFNDQKRFFSDDEIAAQYAKQRGLDALDGQPLLRKDAVGGHILAHSKGGQTVQNNLMVIHQSHNSKMGSMTPDEYKASDRYQPRKQKAA